MREGHTADFSHLRPALDRLYREFDRSGRISDPIELVRPFSDPADAEIVGFCAAGLAFGRVASILASVAALLEVLGPSPSAFVRRFEPERDRARFDHLGHRWTRGRDLAALIWILKQMLEDAGSIEQYFLDGDTPGSVDIGAGLERFCQRARQLDVSRVYGGEAGRPGAHGFFAQPSAGSACKRLNLFLRWMVRRDRIDLGTWRGVSPARLIIPLDVHVVRVGRCLRLTRYQTAGWRMAADITASLRTLDADDPVRYDFALCHVGMLNLCGLGRPAGDSACPLKGACRPRAGRRRASGPPSGPR
ncbi:MAG: TIGR02757 family protein [Acidobacteriota bacterium]